MKVTISLFLIIAFSLFAGAVHSQEAGQIKNPSHWNAHWIASANDDGSNYGVYYFRKEFNLNEKPGSFIIHLSADNRYKLFINDSLISVGPIRGDLRYWYYETIDLSPYLQKGKNIIAAMVFNEAQHRPEAQITLRTAFILQGNTKTEEILNTDKTWKCFKDEAYLPIPEFYFAASKGQLVDMNKTIGTWTSSNFDDTNWKAAANLFEGKLKGMSDGFGWMLVPSPLPAREMTYERIPLLRSAEGISPVKDFPAHKNLKSSRLIQPLFYYLISLTLRMHISR
ncbi:alpha-L-rhamnosidase N-terminal domain-containing protein [Niabella ginsengisoli]|uniref:Alpha-L-rhamnosidase N-terminal domain-containing protein n=1 Tax=Niabella ginsengisoli TaxID=522298 RepID=A0ABS9SLF3_9BACT|nr:alpha-L-rhamnosidase N-terminal domain-containing protein [Niabella ginsengisoli]MCH5599199.1 alpha-L-rhamnosidase N-terminal domain-containing protein [Niabella ginsengisoli]